MSESKEKQPEPLKTVLEISKAAKLKSVKTLGVTLDKQFGSTTFQRQGLLVNKPIPHISTNLPSVDRTVFGCGGAPRGRIIEIFGPESSGKTALSLHIIAQCQKAGGVAAFVDAEHGLSPTFANTLGVNMDELIISQPDCGEDALEIVEALVQTRACDLIVVDSVTALVPRAELEGEMGDSHMGLQARLMSQALRKLVGITSKAGVTIIFINQIREKVGLVFGSPEVTTGGRALKFYASVRLEVRRLAVSKKGLIKDGTGDDARVIGHRANVKAVKNKVAMPFRESVIDLLYETGFDTREDTITHALEIGVLTGNAWFVIKGKTDRYRRDDLPLDTLEDAINAYYSDLQVKLLAQEVIHESEESEQIEPEVPEGPSA